MGLKEERMNYFIIFLYLTFLFQNLLVNPQIIKKRNTAINRIKAKQDKVVYEEAGDDVKNNTDVDQRDFHNSFNINLVLNLDSQGLLPTFETESPDTTTLPSLWSEDENINTILHTAFPATVTPSDDDNGVVTEEGYTNISSSLKTTSINLSGLDNVSINIPNGVLKDDFRTISLDGPFEQPKQHKMGSVKETVSDTEEHSINNHELKFGIKDEVIVSKCCGENEIFNLSSNLCVKSEISSEFSSMTSSLIFISDNEKKKVLSQISPLNFCSTPEVIPSVISDVNNDTFALLTTGELLEIESEIFYGTLEYCLDIGVTNTSFFNLTLMFCQQYSEEYFDGNEYDLDFLTPEFLNSKHVVRKCCGKNEYYNSEFHKCSHLGNSELFHILVQGVTFENNVTVETFSSRIHECPGQSGPPSVVSVADNQYKLLANGNLIETATGIQYNISYYCLELVGDNDDALTFTLAFCPLTIAIQKCCSDQSYFDEIDLNCKTINTNISTETETFISYFQKDFNKYMVVPMDAFLMCENTFPAEEPSQKFVIEDGELCNEVTCFERKDYCIEYIGKKSTNLLPTAFYCQREFFIKCCKKGFLLSENGCTRHEGKPSLFLRQLQNTRSYVNSFDSQKCNNGRGVFLDDGLSSYVSWWINKDGRYLTVTSEAETIRTSYYCIDDYLSNDGKVSSTGAFVCEDVVSHMVPKDKSSLNLSGNVVLSKCCPTSSAKGTIYYYSKETGNCELFNTDQSLIGEIKSENFTEIQFSDFPLCQNEDIKGYSAYSLYPGFNDYATVSKNGVLNVISVDEGCAIREDVIAHHDYCIEYSMSENKVLIASAFVCSYETVSDFYIEKFTLVTSLLGISCFCLLVTLCFLFTMRVRRGLVSVRKVNTLAGRILVSFVSSHLLGFIALTLTQHRNLLNQVTSYSCYAIAGMIEFFNLATFCWNTSICLESLLLTYHITISEGLRYTLHSLWAWGFPALMTTFMFLMDFYRKDLPCGIVTPKIGVWDCFLKDSNAIMLYFYVPIFLTLIANISLLILAKSMRKARLRKLEGSKPRKMTAFGRKSENGTAADKNLGPSGLRTHQNKNTKVESMRIVFWTGGLWFAELLGFVMNWYIFPTNLKKWYRYLWYIPTSLNALRGVGVFVIVVLTPEMRNKIKSYLKIATRPICKILGLCSSYQNKRKPSSSYAKNSVSHCNTFHNQRKRNMSVVTVISNLSSSFHSSSLQTESLDNTPRKQSVSRYISSKWTSIKERSLTNTNDKLNGRKNSLDNSKPIQKFGIIRSVSQIDQQLSASSIGFPQEDIEMTGDYLTRNNPNNLQTTPLPKLFEEDNISNKTIQDSSKNL